MGQEHFVITGVIFDGCDKIESRIINLVHGFCLPLSYVNPAAVFMHRFPYQEVSKHQEVIHKGRVRWFRLCQDYTT